MTLNGVMAIILRYLSEFDSFRGQLRKSGWLSINRFSSEICHEVPYTNCNYDGRAVFFAIAERFVTINTGEVRSVLAVIRKMDL